MQKKNLKLKCKNNINNYTIILEMIIGVDYYETDKADVRDYKTWKYFLHFQVDLWMRILHTEGSGFCQCPDRKYCTFGTESCRGKTGALRFII